MSELSEKISELETKAKAFDYINAEAQIDEEQWPGDVGTQVFSIGYKLAELRGRRKRHPETDAQYAAKDEQPANPTCPDCGGSGDNSMGKCFRCQGTGTLTPAQPVASAPEPPTLRVRIVKAPENPLSWYRHALGSIFRVVRNIRGDFDLINPNLAGRWIAKSDCEIVTEPPCICGHGQMFHWTLQDGGLTTDCVGGCPCTRYQPQSEPEQAVVVEEMAFAQGDAVRVTSRGAYCEQYEGIIDRVDTGLPITLYWVKFNGTEQEDYFAANQLERISYVADPAPEVSVLPWQINAMGERVKPFCKKCGTAMAGQPSGLYWFACKCITPTDAISEFVEYRPKASPADEQISNDVERLADPNRADNEFWARAQTYARDIAFEASRALDNADKLYHLKDYRFQVQGANRGRYDAELLNLNRQIADHQKDLDESYKKIQARLDTIYRAETLAFPLCACGCGTAIDPDISARLDGKHWHWSHLDVTQFQRAKGE